jgi:hypothetical protein
VPLQEVIPADDRGGAQLTITAVDMPVMLGGLEGAELFARLKSADGTVALDRRIHDGLTHWLPPGDYRMTGYYRACVGTCQNLEHPPQNLCATDVSLTAGHSYEVVFSVATCTFRER